MPTYLTREDALHIAKLEEVADALSEQDARVFAAAIAKKYPGVIFDALGDRLQRLERMEAMAGRLMEV